MHVHVHVHVGVYDGRYTVVVEVTFAPHHSLHTNDSLILRLVGKHWTMDTVTYRIATRERGRGERERQRGWREKGREGGRGGEAEGREGEYL